jgi:predicted methyltransferase MtxX (methanogen marker protein 4)
MAGRNPDVTVASGGRERAFGRMRDFDRRSAGICRIAWKGKRG